MTTARIGILVCAIGLAAVLAPQGLRLIPESSPVERGAAAANSHGCIDCHGKPEAAFPDDANLTCGITNNNTAHPRYAGRCSDVLAYFEVVRLKRTFQLRTESQNHNRLLHGENLARRYNCFQCHGELGQGGFRNAGALKGYIPGYFGRDFDLLTRNGSAESVGTWIRHGIDRALFSRPIEGAIAEFFIERQAISMPVFGSLPNPDIEVLTDYVVALHEFGAMDAKAIRAYSRATQLMGPDQPAASLGNEDSIVE